MVCGALPVPDLATPELLAEVGLIRTERTGEDVVTCECAGWAWSRKEVPYRFPHMLGESGLQPMWADSPPDGEASGKS